ncbi:3',5'-cyclic AMP phosphodiesterase CpdA [Sphingomonas vulcanisoli]|uniref:3',5'-cyclic AMP phosphodiesterase CpdA n=1 Tax=Sphingomonas vulcanisoli TaxID=1658060 RepID=A0ABX0TYG8_9SPHN|nr:metallophosphoesterase [Sphingomonas vulcanisoli]NIJ08800.1 3',5'-cyclic AMP phosphodiesterase CpdA [Sphingomonas vulcanisoli]
MTVRIFHVSDLHFGREDAAAIAGFAEIVRAERPDVVVCTGDLTMRARRREFAAAGAWLKSLGVPVTIEPGNHDLPYFNPVQRLLDPYKRYGRIERAIERPIALPGVLLVPLRTTARIQLRSLAWGRVSQSGLKAAQAAICARPPGTLAIVTCHHPLARAGFEGHGDTAGGSEALRALAEAGASAVLSGHVHDAFDVVWPTAAGPIRLIGAGTLSERTRETPPSFNELHDADGKLSLRIRSINHREKPTATN